MTKQIQITDEVYETLAALKERYRCKSFTVLLRKFATDFDTRDMLAHELSEMFNALKKEIVATVLDGKMSGLLELMRVITVNVAKASPEYRSELIDEVTRILTKAMNETMNTIKGFEKEVRKRKGYEYADSACGWKYAK